MVGRTKAIFDRFPLAQRTMEIAESTLIGHLLGRPGDWVGGPAVMPAVHVATLADSSLYGTDRHGWGVPWYLLGRAHREHLTIGIIKTGCGPLASNVDEFNPGYRLLQANSILGCFHEGAGVDYDWQEYRQTRPLRSASISSSVRSLVSGTSRATKTTNPALMAA